MKTILLVSALFVFLFTPAYAQSFSDATGLTNRLDIETGGHSFEVTVTANFDVPNYEFDRDEKKLVLYITSGLENNLGEILVPRNLLSGNLTFLLNDESYRPNFYSNERISFVILNFTGSGDNKLEIFGTTYLSGLSDAVPAIHSERSGFEDKAAFGDSVDWMILAVLLAGTLAATFAVVKSKKRALSAGS